MREIRSPLDGIPSPFAARAALDAYLVGAYSPKVVADFAGIYSANEYYRTGGSTSTFSDLFTYTGASNKTMVDSDGLLKWAPHNLALNSAAPATQSITVVSGADYTVEITGSGSVALSGAGSGTVTAGNPVEITASTTTLTLTVTGTPTTMWAYRSDLGGMVNNPDRNDSYVPTTSSIVHLPRRNHYGWNGSSYVNKGLLLETESRTNVITTSTPTSSTWNEVSATITEDTLDSPLGTNSASKIVESFGTSSHDITLSVTVSATPYCTWAIAKAGERDFMILGGPASTDAVWFNLSSGSVGTVQANASNAGITSLGDGYYLCHFVSTPSAGASTVAVWCSIADNVVSYTGDGSSGVYVAHVQCEAGSTPSSYMPTTGATFTRAAETLTIPAAKMAWPTPNVIGPELVTNGEFENNINNWSLGGTPGAGDSIQWNNGVLEVTRTTNNITAYQGVTTEIGAVYQVILGNASDSFSRLYVSNSTAATTAGDILGAGVFYFVATATTTYIHLRSAAIATQTFDNVSVREIDPLSVSLQMQGEMTYADTGVAVNTDGVSGEVVPHSWTLNSSNYISAQMDTLTSGATGQLNFRQEANGVADSSLTSSNYFSPDVNVPFNISSRHGSTFINGAVDGTALTADTTPTALPDLSATDFKLGYDYMGTIALFREDNNDWGDAGIEEAST